MDEAQQSYLNLLKKTFEKRQEFIRYDVTLFHEYQNKLTVHSSALSRNCELLVCGCSKSIVILYDLIAKKSYKANNTKKLQFRKHQIVTISFSNCYDYVIAGNTMGDLLIYQIGIDTQNHSFVIDLIRFISQFHEKAIQTIYHSSIDHLLTISSEKLRITMVSEFIKNENITDSLNQINLSLNGVTASKIMHYKDNYHLYIGLRDNTIIKIKTPHLFNKPKNEKQLHKLQSSSSVINKLEASNNQKLLAIAFQSGQQELGNIIVLYLKKGKQIYSKNGITRLKISELVFFSDNSHLCVGSWDGTFQLLNIAKKELLQSYTHTMHSIGVIAFFPITEASQFPTLISIGQDHVVKKYYFGTIRDQLFEYIPFIFWVEQRIRQELQFQSELHTYQKMLYIESMGVDSVKMRELNQSIFGYETFSPLMKRVIDYTEYAERSSILFRRYEIEKLEKLHLSQQKSNKLPPLEISQKLPSVEGSNSIREGSMKNSLNLSEPVFNYSLLEEHYLFTFRRITETIELGKIKMMVLQKCNFIFEEKLPFRNSMYEMLQKMKKLKYLDLSFNSLGLDEVLQILEQLKGVTTLDFLSLAHNKLGEGATRLSNSDALMRLLDEVVAISLRSNKLSDLDGEAILNQIKHFKKLNILDISGNLDFKEKTLQALQRITILQNKIEFAAQRNDYLGFLNKIKFIQEKEIQEELLEQQQQFEPDKQSNVGEDNKLIENLPEIDSKTIDRQSSISSAGTYMSLQLLCIQFQKEVCEQAMKTATDFLVQKKITNLYIYVVDNKEDDVWETSISIFYTRGLKKLNDYIFRCVGGVFIVIFTCFENLYKTIRYDGNYCLKRMFCTNYFLWKYLACGFCTFLTTRFGKFIVTLFGVESSYYEFNPKIVQLEAELMSKRRLLFTLFAIYFASYYFVVIFLPIIFVNECQGQKWTGHLLYLSFAGYSFLVEGYLGLTISNLKVTTNEYTDGSTTARYFYIIKDLLISQLTKFELYTCVCFIVLINSCQVQTIIAWVGVAIIGVNLLFDLALIVRYLLVPYIYKQKLSYIDVFTQFSTLYQMNIVTNLLEKWSEQNTISLFCLSQDVPQKVVVSIIKTFFQDIPLLLLQAIYLGLNQNQIQIQILVVSLIVVIIHCVFSIIKMLSITRAAKINEEIMLTEMVKNQNSNSNKLKNVMKELKRFIRRFKRRIIQLIFENNEKNENVLLSLIDTERAFLNRPHTLHNLDQFDRQKSAKIMPARKGITQIGNKIQRVNISKNSKISASELFKKISVKSSLDIFGPKVKSWKLSNDIPLDITDTLLSDVPRQLFTIDLDWESQQPWIGNIKISSMHQEIEGFQLAYQFFKDKQQLDILDLGFGSGYVAFVLIVLAFRRNLNMKITLYLVDHHQDTVKHFSNKLFNEFPHLQQKVKFEYYVHNCLDGYLILKEQKFDYIHMGFAASKWRISSQIIPLLKEDGKLFGYEIISSIQQKQIIWSNLEKQFYHSQNLENYGIMEPITIQLKDMTQFYSDDSIVKPEITTYIKFYSQCAICSKSLTNADKQFINHYWGECICFTCGNENLEQQGEEIDIAKISYKSNVIYFSGENCKLSSIKQNQVLLDNLTYPFGHKSGTLREYQMTCSSCNSKRGFGFQYKCLVCLSICYCNSCGLLLMNDDSMKFHTICSPAHPLLRIMFPQKTTKGKK